MIILYCFLCFFGGTYLTINTSIIVKYFPLICAIKIDATASYSAVPSILIVAPIGRTKRVTRLSMPRFCSKQRNVIGRVAALDAVPSAVIQAFFRLYKQSGKKR